MKEYQSSRQLHLESLHALVNIPFKEDLSIRSNKEHILEGLGFSKGTNVALKREFVLPEAVDETYNIREYIVQQLEDDKFLSMLFKDGNWESMGGSPVIYIMSNEDLEAILLFDNDKMVEARARNGNIVNIDHKINLQTYSRKKSMSTDLSGFANYEEQISVRLGGGFRLQIDNIAFIDNQPCMTLLGCFSFDDMGSRVLELSCKDDYTVPRYESTFLLKITNGRLILSETQNSSNEVGIIVNKVISNLFKNDAEAISNLLRGLLSIRPAMKVYQLEGIFSIASENEISAEIIDFDGIDSYDINGQIAQFSMSEKLLQGQLSSIDYLLARPEDLLSYITYRNKVQEITNSILASTELTENIKGEISRHVSNSFNIFSREQTGPVKLGRLIKNLDISLQNTENPNIKIFKNSNNVITVITIEGYTMAFWKSNKDMVDTTDIAILRSRLSKILKIDIVNACFLYNIEGD